MSQRSFQLLPSGFHGDLRLNEVTFEHLQNATHFIETGTNVGSTLRHVASNFPQVKCWSCEPDEGAFQEAENNTSALSNVTIWNTDSISFLNEIESQIPVRGAGVVCWLDAHGCGFQWPLREEVALFTGRFPKAAIFIDDFKVPEKPEFGFDQYDGQECSLEYIQDSIADHTLEIVFPSYTEHTSQHHPLRGWCLIRKSGFQPGPFEQANGTAVPIKQTV